MELSPTAYVILGMLGWGPMSGYEIKSLVDKSTRFFWAASYGQIYPELRRLAAAGLIEGKAEPAGRPQAKRLPAHGRRAQGAGAWLDAGAGGLRAPRRGALKLFFAGAGRRRRSAPGTLEAMRRTQEGRSSG